jgi:predicted glycogen debranching enzyme
MLLLSKLEETLIAGGKRYDLSANRYPGVVHPQGHQYLKEFRLDPFPVFRYEVEGLPLIKLVFMAHGENTTVIEYQLPENCVLEIRPLIAFRDYHSTTHRNDALNSSIVFGQGSATVNPYQGLPSLHFAHNASEWELTGHWYDNFEYDAERERGLDYQEDLFQPFALRFQGPAATVIASTERRIAEDAQALRRSEIERRAGFVGMAPRREPLVQALTAAADHFIVNRGELKTIIAGYHWFSDWGRDTMIALPGLTLVTGRAAIARSILTAFANSIDRGMLPNRFLDDGEDLEYNTVDATLWFFEAIRSLVKYTGDLAFVRETLYEKLKDILDWHIRGTRYGIRVDSDGLLTAGEPGVQLTWMDAKVGDWVVTPRHGKPVEIQALWYNALRIMEAFALEFGDLHTATLVKDLAGRAHDAFNASFWNDQEGCLVDTVNGEHRDGSIRPNQIFAVSLTHSMLDAARAQSVLEIVERELLTPLGLRSLSPHDPQYRPRYQGGVWERDAAYHQGTVWPWLMGPFLTAYMKVNGHSDTARAQCERWLAAFAEHLNEAGLGQISEIADAAPPFTPRGCVAQAWSIAELLRAAVEDVYDARSASHQSAA